MLLHPFEVVGPLFLLFAFAFPILNFVDFADEFDVHVSHFFLQLLPFELQLGDRFVEFVDGSARLCLILIDELLQIFVFVSNFLFLLLQFFVDFFELLIFDSDEFGVFARFQPFDVLFGILFLNDCDFLFFAFELFVELFDFVGQILLNSANLVGQ